MTQTEPRQGAGITELSGAEIARSIRARQIGPVEVVDAFLARARDVDEKVRAWERLDAERARQAAGELEEALARGESPRGALDGVPFGVKDVFDTAGLRTAAGFGPFDERVPSRDAAAVVHMREAGAVLLGKLVSTQLEFIDPPRTRNPWRPDRTPGGSSSGSAAAVAAREIPLALGSQTAGSVLRPAAYTGVVGFKPTYGRVSTRGVLPLAWTMDHAGVLARSVEDCELFLQACSAEPLAGLNAWIADHPPHLGLLEDALELAAPGVRQNVEATAERFARAGAEVRTMTLGEDFDLVLAVHTVILHAEASAVHWQLLEQYPGSFQPRIQALIEAGRLVPADTYLHALRLRKRIRASVLSRLEGVDAFLLPTAVDVAPGPETTGDPSLQIPFSLTGFPAISLPSGRDADGMPHAIQLAAAAGRDEDLLAVARWCEAHLEPLPGPPV